jgi:hypothetical protein
MQGKIYLIDKGDQLRPMTEQPYPSEDLLQKLLEDYPDLLAGEQINQDTPRRWLLISREMGVPAEENGGDRWSLDHLFVDQDGIPTLVEVKRSSDTRTRREVVAQMLDYAANAIVHWPIETIRVKFENSCEQNDKDAEAELSQFLENGAEDRTTTPEAFWSTVSTNLQAGKIRMVFVADRIPSELQRIIEFLNEQMEQIEVLAVELRQFVGEGIRTLVPRVLGLTASAQQKKASGSGQRRLWDEESFIADAKSRLDQTEVSALERLHRACIDLGCDISWGIGVRAGSFKVRNLSIGPKTIFVIYSHGRLDLYFGYLEGNERLETFRDQFKQSLEKKLGLRIPAVKYPTFPKEEWIAKVDVLIAILTELLGDRSAA